MIADIDVDEYTREWVVEVFDESSNRWMPSAISRRESKNLRLFSIVDVLALFKGRGENGIIPDNTLDRYRLRHHKNKKETIPLSVFASF